MVRSLAVGFGTLTALALAGAMTPVGQGMLGQRHAPEQAVPVSSIQDKPAAIPGPAQSLVAAPVAPKAVPAPASPAASPAVAPAPRRPQAGPVAPRPQAAPRAERSQVPPQAVPTQGGPGGLAGVANILLNLPQVLDQTHVGPSQGPDSWSGSQSSQGDEGGKPHKRHRGHGPAPEHEHSAEGD